MSSLHTMVSRALEDGVLTAEDHEAIIDTIAADGRIDEEESAEISRIFSCIESSKVKVVDPERERFQRLSREEMRELYGL